MSIDSEDRQLCINTLIKLSINNTYCVKSRLTSVKKCKKVSNSLKIVFLPLKRVKYTPIDCKKVIIYFIAIYKFNNLTTVTPLDTLHIVGRIVFKGNC